MKMKIKTKSWGSDTHIRQNTLQKKAITRDKEGRNIMPKQSIQQEAVTLVNICALNTGAAKVIKRILMDIKGEIHSNTVTAGGFNEKNPK